MSDDVSVQLGMFGVGNRIAGAHVVQAHTRVLATGDEVFVAEHLRWNRRGAASSTPRSRRPRAAEGTEQQELFGAARATEARAWPPDDTEPLRR